VDEPTVRKDPQPEGSTVMVNLVNASPNRRATSKKRPTNQFIRDLSERGLWPIIALLLIALALVTLAMFPGTEPNGSEILIGP
jgi:hypothetical protein